MKLKNPHLWIATVSAAAVVFVALIDVGRTSPGPLTMVHGRIDSLQGRSGCADCHGGWTSDMTTSCLECHAAIEEQVAESEGLHGTLSAGEVEACGSCHAEHHGSESALINRQSFARAGIPDAQAFDHRLVGFPMAGGHLELGCSECHEHAETPVLPTGARRFLGLDWDCASCHEDKHEGRMVLDCASCHAQESFERLGSHGHERFLPLVGAHGALSCVECHAEDGPRSLVELGEGRSRLAARDCMSCHESPHADEFLASMGRLTRGAPGTSCAACHEAEHTSFHDEALTVSAAQHAASGFQLQEPHHEVGCEDCHQTAEQPFAERFPGRKADECAVCHADPHAGQFAGGTFGGGCLDCHSRQHFEPHGFDLDHHARTGLPLTGAHAKADCAGCHEQVGDEARSFQGTSQRCEDCHADAHDGFFETFFTRETRDEEAVRSHGACALCHGTRAFGDLPPGGFDHGAWTGFPLLGAHAAEECSICHPASARVDRQGRRFGRVHEHFGTFQGCETCHNDPHEGSFDGLRHPLQVEGRTGCARCHEATSFRSFPEGFDHRLWTGFELSGAHGEAGCADCHVPLRHPEANGRSWKRAAGKQCSACHESPHAGQFAQGGNTDCRRCHRSAEAFSELAFDHERDARFALGEAHGSLACSACHESVHLETGQEVVRYRPMKRECVDCHGVHEEPLRRRRGGK